MEDFFDHMVANTRFEREAGRSKEFEPVVARVSAADPNHREQTAAKGRRPKRSSAQWQRES